MLPQARWTAFPIALMSCAPAATLPSEQPRFALETLAERRLEELPAGPLYWRIERFASLTEAQAAAGATSMAADVSGEAWLFTLGVAGEATAGATRVAEIGPVPSFAADAYVLRVNRAGGAPGAETEAHSHPGVEAFYVLSGELTQRTPHGVVRVEAGQSMNGHAPGTTMQLASTGAAELDQIVLFVVDAAQPFSSPAAFDDDEAR